MLLSLCFDSVLGNLQEKFQKGKICDENELMFVQSLFSAGFLTLYTSFSGELSVGISQCWTGSFLVFFLCVGGFPHLVFLFLGQTQSASRNVGLFFFCAHVRVCVCACLRAPVCAREQLCVCERALSKRVCLPVHASAYIVRGVGMREVCMRMNVYVYGCLYSKGRRYLGCICTGCMYAE